MGERETATVIISFDRNALNTVLGNTPNATSEYALREVFESLMTDGLASPCGCGCNCFEPDPLPITFEIIET